MLLDYYVGAFTRSWSAAWLWATGQGILLTWLLAVGLSIASIAIAVGRAAIKYHSWQEAKNHVGNTLADFAGVVVLSSIITLIILFGVFFVRNAPDQIAAANKAIDNLKSENAKAITELKAKYEDDIGQLNKKIVELQLRLDDRERRRREHEEEVRVKNERINTIAGLIATGNVIAKSFEEKNDKDLVKEQYLEWERDALESLASGTFGVTYLAPFGSAKGTGTSLMNHKIPGVNASHSETVRRCPALNQREHNGGASCAAPPPNSGKNHYLKRLNHASRSAPWKYSRATTEGRHGRVSHDAGESALSC